MTLDNSNINNHLLINPPEGNIRVTLFWKGKGST